MGRIGSMSPTDFSHYRLTPALIARAVSKGHRITDEDLLEVLDRWRLPIGRAGHVAIRRLLGPSAKRRGRPSADVMPKTVLLARLRLLRTQECHHAFINVIIERLQTGADYTRSHSNRDYARRWRIPNRDAIINGVYDQIYDLLAGDPTIVEHPILGSIEVPVEIHRTRHEKALKITQDLLAQRTAVRPPSLGTMLKIISKNPLRKRRPRT